MIVVFYHRITGYEWVLTEQEFQRLMRIFREGKTLPEYYEFLKPAYYREIAEGRLPPTLPFSTFVQMTLGILEGRRELGTIEFRLDTIYYRLMTAVMYYALEDIKKGKTPDPFADFRAWTIVPHVFTRSTKVRAKIFKQLEREAWYLPVLFASMYVAFERGSIGKVTESGGWNNRKELYLGSNIIPSAVRVGWEVREIDGSEDEITVEEANMARMRIARGAAFYKGSYDSWRLPYAKFDEKWIRCVEILLTQTDMCRHTALVRDFKDYTEFKQFCAERFKAAADEIEYGRLDTAFQLVQAPYAYVAECTGGTFWLTNEVIEELLAGEEVGVPLDLGLQVRKRT